MHNNPFNAVKPQIMFLRILYANLVIPIFLYIFILFQITGEDDLLIDVGLDDPIYYPLTAVAAMVAIGVLGIRFTRIKALLSLPLGAASPSEGEILNRLVTMRFWYILMWTLSEAVGLFGFTLALLANDPYVAFPHIGAALVLFALTFPQVPKSQPDPMSGPIG